ncbi:MAG: DUF3341 domain-containing protein [Dehalococcoidia bacterium]|nr:DUF3341 domain-containing protein [Dehalococcoidia bacterium]
MVDKSILGLFKDPDSTADAVDSLRKAGFGNHTFDILSGVPYPEGTFGEHGPGHKLFVFPLIGAICGFSVALLLTLGTQVSFPMVQGGKPLIAIPPMMVIMYEGTMLGAILFTVLGVLFESRLPRPGVGLYDTRITEGFIGLLVSCPEEKIGAAEQALRGAGAEDIKTESASGGGR